MRNKHVIGFIMVFCLSLLLTGAASAGQWAKTYGTTGSNTVAYIWPAGSSYYLSGNTTPAGGHTSGLFAKISSSGSVLWAKTLGGTTADDTLSSAPLQDGSVLVSGQSGTFKGFVFAKYGMSGSTWTPVFQQAFKDVSAEGVILETDDGGFLFSGSHKYSASDSDMMFFKTDKAGKLQWKKDYNYNTSDSSSAGVAETADGFLVAVSASTGNPYIHNTIVMKLDKADGGIVWKKMFSSTGSSISAGGFFETQDGYYILSGALTPPPSPTAPMPVSKALLIKINPANGGIIWSKAYSGGTTSVAAHPMLENADGSLILSGMLSSLNTTTYAMTFNPLVMKVSDKGGVLWKKKYSGGGMNMASAYEASTGEILLLGTHTTNSAPTNTEVLYGKLDPATFDPLWVKTFGGSRPDMGYFGATATTHWLSGSTASFGGATNNAMKAFGVILAANGTYAGCSSVKPFALNVASPAISAAAITLTKTTPTIASRTVSGLTSITLVPKTATLPANNICPAIAGPVVQSPEEAVGEAPEDVEMTVVR